MLYVPTLPCDLTLSRWTGRPHGLRPIDPLGVECFLPAPAGKRKLFGRRTPEAPPRYLHVLTHTELPEERIRSWARMQIARLAVVAQHEGIQGDALNRLVEDEAGRLAHLPWTPAQVVVDDRAREASVVEVDDGRWAAFIDLGDHRLALVARGVPLGEASLRTATPDEERRVTADALRV